MRKRSLSGNLSENDIFRLSMDSRNGPKVLNLTKNILNIRKRRLNCKLSRYLISVKQTTVNFHLTSLK